jgi:hypothetical protein
VISVETVRLPNVGKRSGEPIVYWPHGCWLIQAVERGVVEMSVEYTLRSLSIAMIVA